MTKENRLLAREVRGIAAGWVESHAGEFDPSPLPAGNGDEAEREISLGLPEWDDRFLLWRVALVPRRDPRHVIGEIRIDAAGEIRHATDVALVRDRLQESRPAPAVKHGRRSSSIHFPPIPNKAILGDSRLVLAEFPPQSVQLVFTSPPYFNAKPEYAQYKDYASYLDFLGEVFSACHDILAEGRFLVVNVSPVLLRRSSRSAASKRLPIPFDLHPILDRIGFAFIDDIIWRKPEGAGWHLGRGRRFAADRQPLQYKPVTVTENILVYRKKTDRLIDWNLRNHPHPDAVKRSRILGEYDKTNVWEIAPAKHKGHPAVFPAELVRKVVRYYSFEGDSVLDPFAGTGTVGRVAIEMGRRFVLVEKSRRYYEIMRQDLGQPSLLTPQNGSIDFDDLQYSWSSDDDA